MMSTSVINGIDFYNYFRSGVERVRENRELLNQINVFPVKDGDTGTNLMVTMSSIAEETEVSSDFNVVIHSMSNVAFENARGNSGIIFASFINGFYRACGHLKTLTIEQFAMGAEGAAKEVYSAVDAPVEGTILTVVREWAKYLNTNREKHRYFEDLLINAYENVNKILDETPEMLDVLKKNRVVDAGAKGFVLFLEGINSIVQGKKNDKEVPVINRHQMIHEHTADEESFEQFPTHRFCTEILVYQDIENKAEILRLISDLGDSVIVTGNQEISKIHVHTNSPAMVTKRLIEANYRIRKSKVEDMYLQFDVKQNPKAKIAILTDSIADIEDKQLLKEQIHTLPIALIADDSVYLDKLTANHENIHAILDNSQSYPTSSQLDEKQIMIRLESLLEVYEHVVIVSVSSKLSGTWSSFKNAILKVSGAEERVTLVDSKLNSGAQGLVVLEAAKRANRGESLKIILEGIRNDIQNASILVSLDTFKYAVKGGRVPNTIGNILLKLNLKPIMSLNKDGEGTAFGLALRRKTIDRMIFNKVKRLVKQGGMDRYAIVHIGNQPLAEKYRRTFEELTGKSPEIFTEISSITAIHAGIGAVAIACITNDKR